MRTDNQLKISGESSQNQLLKKSILWNVVQPGDPYDIRKSMIARLPGDNRNFMGNKLELVCLLQAAEIERLALNLDEYRVRFNEVEKGSLDRHSYEVQIKELAEKLQVLQSLKAQNLKLKKFSQRLNQELQETKIKYSSGSNQLNTNYQQALLQIQSLTEQNTKLTSENSNFKQIVTSINNENQFLKSQIHSLDLQKNEDARKMEQYEEKFTLLGDQIKRLNSVLKSKTEEIYRLSEEHNQIKTYLSTKKEQNQLLRGTQIKLTDEMTALRIELEKTEKLRKQYEEETKYIQQLKDKSEKAGKEVEKINEALIRTQKENQLLKITLMQSENKIQYLTRTLNDKNSEITQLEEEINKAQNNSSLLGPEIERLNSVLKTKLTQLTNMQSKLTRISEENTFYSSQISVLQKQNKEAKRLKNQLQELQMLISTQQAEKSKLSKTNSDLMRKMNQFSLQRQKSSGFEEKLSKVTKQFDESRDTIQILTKENKDLIIRIKQSENLEEEHRRNSKQLSDLKNVMYQQDLKKKNLQQRIIELEKEYNEYKTITNQLSNEIKRLNEVLRIKLTEHHQISKQYQDSQKEIKKYEEIKVNAQAQKGKIQQYENRFALLSLEIERLNSNVKIKVNQKQEADREVESLRREVNGLRIEINECRVKIGNAKNAEESYEMKLVACQREIQRLNEVIKMKLAEVNHSRRQIQHLRIQVEEAKNRDKELGDLERLNSLLRLKVEQAAKWQASNTELIRKIEYVQGNFQGLLSQNRELKSQLHRFGTEKTELYSQLHEYRIKVDRVGEELERLHNLLNNMKTENSELKRELFELKKQSTSGLTLKEKNEKLLKEIERLKGIVQIQQIEVKELRVILSQDYAMDRRLKEQLSLIVVLFAEIETLRKRIDDKQKEIEVVRRESLVTLKD